MPFDLAPTAGPSDPSPSVRRPRTPPPIDRNRFRLRNDALASHGWPAGTELLVDPDRRPRRGQVALVSEGGRLKIGVFDLQLGRGVLRTDRGSVWLGASARFVGVVTLVGAPFEGMPDVAG
ncbi:hypothetical protein ASD81_13155 [Nocardioides sp. Root614]|nr:hypothetical protein ASD81_13155 [Nocardioides sp. Root614]KRA89153.1 hypothetical protein ASD84_13420 [Nocardioides sp. Root682]